MTGHRTRLSVCLALLAVLALALPGAQAAQPAGSAEDGLLTPAAQHTLFLPFVASQTTAAPASPTVRFWAERYALDEGTCTLMHWRVTGAQSVLLDNVAVAAVGVLDACPTGPAQFYSLEVQIAGSDPGFYELVLGAGDPGLLPGQVIAHGAVQGVVAAADTDPATDGNQPGFIVHLRSVVRLYADDTNWNETTVNLAVPQSLIDYGFNGPVHWPVQAGQQVEFRANCEAAACMVVEYAPTYLYLRSE